MKKRILSLQERKKGSLLRLTATAVCLALAMLLPFFTGQLRELGQALSPMHLPVLLCGLLCGWPWGLLCGVVAPLFRSLCFGMPLLFPHAIGMAAELGGYGFLSGFLYRRLPKRLPFLYLSLLGGMIFGRVTGAAFKLILLTAGLIEEYSLALFVSGYLVGTLPGMAVQLLFIPPIVTALRRAGLMLNEKRPCAEIKAEREN